MYLFTAVSSESTSVICQVLDYGVLHIPSLIQHKNAVSVGCSLETQMFCKTVSCPFLVLSNCQLKSSS